MRERATLLDGVFIVSSTPGAGTTIEVELPLVMSGTDPEAVATDVLGREKRIDNACEYRRVPNGGIDRYTGNSTSGDDSRQLGKQARDLQQS